MREKWDTLVLPVQTFETNLYQTITLSPSENCMKANELVQSTMWHQLMYNDYNAPKWGLLERPPTVILISVGYAQL